MDTDTRTHTHTHTETHGMTDTYNDGQNDRSYNLLQCSLCGGDNQHRYI